MAAVVVARAPAPVVAGLATRRSAWSSDGENRNAGSVQCAGSANESGIQLKQSRRVTAYLQRCSLFARHLHSNVLELRGNCGRLVTVSGSKGSLFDQRSSSAFQGGIEKLADAVGITAWPRGPSWCDQPETLRRTHGIHRPETSQRRSSVRTHAGRNKKWRTLDKQGRLEGSKRTRSIGNANAKSKPSTPRPDTKGDGPVRGPEGGYDEDGTVRPAREPRVKPPKGPKPRERVSWAGQEMLLLNVGERHKVGKDVQPWASVRTERMPDDYYKYGPFGPHAWKGVTVGTPRRGTMCDNLVVFFSTVENEAEHEAGEIQDAITGYAKRVDQMDEEVGIQYYFAFVRQVVKVPGQSPWEEWTLVAQVAVESGSELDKWRLGERLDRKMWELLTRCTAWYRPDLVYVKRPAYQVRFEPQKEFLEGLVTMLEPGHPRGDLYYQRVCELLGVDENESAEQVGIVLDSLSNDRKMECVEHVLTAHPVWLLTPFTIEAMKAERQQKSVTESFDVEDEIESIEAADDEGGFSEDDTLEDELDDELEPDMEFGEDFDFDEQGDGNEWEREEAKALAAEAMLDSLDAEPPGVDNQFWNEQAATAFGSEIGVTSRQGPRTAEATVEDTETEKLRLFLDAALRPFTYSNMIKEIFIIRSVLVEMAQLRG